MKLTFGKYKGKEITDPSIPDDYISWMCRTHSWKTAESRQRLGVIAREWARRMGF